MVARPPRMTPPPATDLSTEWWWLGRWMSCTCMLTLSSWSVLLCSEEDRVWSKELVPFVEWTFSWAWGGAIDGLSLGATKDWTILWWWCLPSFLIIGAWASYEFWVGACGYEGDAELDWTMVWTFSLVIARPTTASAKTRQRRRNWAINNLGTGLIILFEIDACSLIWRLRPKQRV